MCMNGIEELGLSTADVNSIAGIDVSDQLLQKAQQKTIFSQLYKSVNVEEGHNSFKYPKSPSSTITVSQDVAPNSSIAISGYVFNAGTIIPRKNGVRVELTNEAIEDASSSNKELVQVMIDEISNEIKAVNDARAYTIALDVQYNTLTESDFTGGTLAASTLKPILEIISSTFNTGSISSWDSADGKILLSSSITSGTLIYSYSNQARLNSQYQNCGTPQTITLADIFTMRSKMRGNSIYPDIVLLNDNDFDNLFITSELGGLWVGVDSYKGNSEPLIGEIGKLLDLKVLCGCTLVPEGISVLVDSSRLGYEAVFRSDVKVEFLPENFSKGIHLWDERDYGISDTLAVGLVVNGNSLAANL